MRLFWRPETYLGRPMKGLGALVMLAIDCDYSVNKSILLFSMWRLQAPPRLILYLSIFNLCLNKDMWPMLGRGSLANFSRIWGSGPFWSL